MWKKSINTPQEVPRKMYCTNEISQFLGIHVVVQFSHLLTSRCIVEGFCKKVVTYYYRYVTLADGLGKMIFLVLGLGYEFQICGYKWLRIGH